MFFNHKFRLVIFFLSAVILAFTGIARAQTAISTCSEIQNMANNPSGTYSLANDVDCSASAAWNAGAGFLPINNFSGTFDGQGHTIFNLTINRPSQNQTGLFASILTNGFVKDLTISNAQITGQSQTGVLTGYMFLAHVSNISVIDSHVNGTSRVGGLIGESYNGTGIFKAELENVTVNGSSEVGGLVGRIWDGNSNAIVQSSIKATVTGTGDSVGGIAGYSKSGDLIESFSEGSVQGNNNVGGIVGNTFENAGIHNSYSKNSVTGNQNVGGIAGLFNSYDDGVSHTYFAGTVTGNSTAGGFLGYYTAGTISSDYWDMTKNPIPGVGNGDRPQITGQSTSQMFQQTTYIGWDFVNIWAIDGDYPTLLHLPTNNSNLVSNCTELQNIIYNPWGTYSLANDVDCSASAAWNAGAGFLPINNFSGTFDGQGHTIFNLTINRPSQNQTGLFASLLTNGFVKDLTISNAQITGQAQTGVLTGYMFLAHVSNISVIGSHVNGTSRVGGLIGESYNGTGILKADLENVTVNGSSEVGGLVGRIWDGNSNAIVQSSIKAAVTGTGDSVGGIAGYSKSGDLIESFSEGSVQGNNNVGGIVGNTYENAGIHNSYSKNSVTGNQNVGGIAGLFNSYDDGVSHTYFAGTVTGNSTAGGFLGYYAAGAISSNYWDMTKNLLPGVGNGDRPQITGKTTAQMFAQSTYTGWDFVNIWRINGNYPELRFSPSYLIKDGFETGNLNNWESWSVPNYQCGLSVEPQAAYEGQYGLHISSPAAASSYCRAFQTFSYHQENLYAEVQTRQRGNWTDGSRAFARIEFWSSNPPSGSVVAAVDCVPDVTQPGQPWTHCIINSASHSWAPYMRLVLSVDNSSTASAPSQADFDKVRFKPIDINITAGRNVLFTDKNSNSTLNFNEVTESGYAEIAQSTSGPQPPAGYALAGPYFDIITTADFSGPVNVCLGYDDSGLTLQDEQSLRLNHYENGGWVDITQLPNNTMGNTVCGDTNSFSPFALFIKEKHSVDLFMHGSGANANPSSLFLNATAPTSTVEKYKDSVGINMIKGNPWKEAGTWTAPAILTNGTLKELADVHTWVGLKNSDDQGTRFDIRTELLRNGVVAASGETYCVQGATRNPRLAKEAIVPFASFAPIVFNGTVDKLSLRVLTRIGTDGAGKACGGHSNADGLRVYFDAVSRPSKFRVTFQ